MRKISATLGCFFSSLFFVLPAFSLVNNSDTLYVESGESISLSNNVYKQVSITVKNGGMIIVAPYDGNLSQGRINLVAPNVKIEGTVFATACGHDPRGEGGAPETKKNGGGGGGYGGVGGAGDGSVPGSGGNIYDTPYAEDPGSFGYGAGTGSSRSGYGGGAIRIDAVSLTVGATAQLLARGNPLAENGVGGGSGGSIVLDGIHTFFQSNYIIKVDGGPGGGVLGNVHECGGGGGGRIKIFEHNSISYPTGTFDLSGGVGGGGTAQNGANNTVTKLSAYLPDAPVLISPATGQVVGTQPTFSFTATDPGKAKFLQYLMEFSYNATFTPLTFTVDQRIPDAGWGGKKYFSSDEIATYTLPAPLATSTTYYWRVKVTNNEGATWSAAYSAYRALTTTAVANQRPTVPKLNAPADQQILVSKIPALQTVCSDPEGDTLTFSVTLSNDASLQNPQTFQVTYPGWDRASYLPAGRYVGVTATCQLLNSGVHQDALIPGMDYYWRITAVDAMEQSQNSPIYHFTTVPMPAAPTLVAPIDLSVVTTRQPTLSMSTTSPTGGTLAYRLELSSDAFQTVLLFNSQSGGGWSKSAYASGEAAQLLIPTAYPLQSGASYQWRGYAYDVQNDNWSAVTPNYSFTVITPPLSPQLLYPEAGYSAPNSQIVFRFNVGSESGNTLNGRFEISSNDFIDTLAVFDQTQSSNGWNASVYQAGEEMQFALPSIVTLERGKTYWWRVRGTDGISWGPYSESRAFSLTNALEFQRVLTVPNPAVMVSDVQIQLNLTADAEVTVRVYNKLGHALDRLQQSVRGGGDVVRLDVSRYASGVYYYVLEAKSDFGVKTITKKFAVVK